MCTLIVLGSGGHTAEMLRLMDVVDIPTPLQFVLAKSDNDSRYKVSKWLTDKGIKAEFHSITRAREVGQSWCSSLFPSFCSLMECTALLANIKPRFILTNGPGTCVPIVYLSYISKLITPNTIVYVESFARVQTLSVSGRLVYPIVDRFVVQWPMSDWPKAEFLGKLY